MIDLAYIIYVLLLLVSIGCALARLWLGPTAADRLNAADVVALCMVGYTIGHGWYHSDPIWLDVAMVAGLILFVGTVAVSMFIDPKDLSREDHD